MKSITKTVGIDYDVEYLRFDERTGYRAIVGVFIRVLTRRYDKVVFLSSKVSQLFPLALLGMKTKCFVIYHYMPSHRRNFHKTSLRILSRFFAFGVYANGVADEIEAPLGFRPAVLPSRIIDPKMSLMLLREKLAKRKIRLLVPGLRPGVRKEVSLGPIFELLEQRLGYKLEEIYIQGEINDNGQACEVIRNVGKLSQTEYDNLYQSSLIVAVNFQDNYEIRASGVILDALRGGCLILSNDHPIIRQYGFPNSIVTDIVHLESVISTINNASDNQALATIPGADFDKFRSIWYSFLS
jgi:hypothetical protein